MKHLALFVLTATALTLSSCGGGRSKAPIVVAPNKANQWGFNRGGEWKENVQGSKDWNYAVDRWIEGGEWVVAPEYYRIDLWENTAGTFYLAIKDAACRHIFDKNGKLLKQFQPDENLNQWAGDYGIVRRAVPGVSRTSLATANNTDESFLFSFAALQTVKELGYNARYIKNARFIGAHGKQTESHNQRRFYDFAGNLIFEASDVVVKYEDDMSKDDWALLDYIYTTGKEDEWLNLATGKTYPSKSYYNPPAVSESKPAETDANIRYVDESFESSGISVTFRFGFKNTQTQVFIVSNENDYACKVVIKYSTEDGKTGTVETTVKPKEKDKEIDPKVDINYPVSSWSVKEISKIN